MADNLDPAFLAAPFFGQSTYDPLAAVRQAKAMRYEMGYAKKKSLQDDMEKGLKELNFDIKGWSDDQGFNEISKDLEDLRSKYTELGARGYNLSRPSSMEEQKLSRAFNTALTNLKQKHDVWQEEKGNIEMATKVIAEEMKKPEDQRTIDTDATLQAINDWKNTKGGVLDRAPKSQDLIVSKATPVDIGKYFAQRFDDILKGEDVTQTAGVDPISGRVTTTKITQVDETRKAAALEKIMAGSEYAPPSIKNAINRGYEQYKQSNPDSVWNKQDWIRNTFMPETPFKKEKNIKGGNGEFNLNWASILPGKTDTGMYDTNQYKETKSFAVPAFDEKGQSISGQKETFNSSATIPLQGVFKTVFTMPNGAHGYDAETGKLVPQGRNAANMADNISFIPVAKKSLSVVIDGKTRTFKPGDKLPAAVQRQLDKEDRTGEYMYDAFLTALTSYKQIPKEATGYMKELQDSGFDLGLGTGSNYSTTVTPWREAERYVTAAASRSKVDLKPLNDFINNYLDELNGMSSIFGEKVTEDTYKQLYGDSENNK